MGRYIIFGAGAVGCLIGGRLCLAGHDVVLIARGAHREALARDGLRLNTPTQEHVIQIPTVGDIDDISLLDTDVVVLTMKTQDSAGALNKLAAAAPPGISVVCAQNGVESERLALRLFEKVYGAYVFVFAAIIRAGVVHGYSAPCLGIVDFGRYPHGQDTTSACLAIDFTAAGFQSLARPDVMSWKRGKLLINVGNVIHAACPSSENLDDVLQEAREEAERCFGAAHLDFIRVDEVMSRGMEALSLQAVEGQPFPGGSTAQGLERGSTSSEVDYLNGEITLLGRSLGFATPVNSALQQFMREMIKRATKPGSVSSNELHEILASNISRPTR
jgi:2-dehydropantoate 2-reductase